MKCVINKVKDVRVLLSISKRASLNEVILNNFFIVNNVRPLIYLCYLLLPNLLFDVLHRWMVLRLTGGRKLLCLPISAKTRDSWNMRRKKVKKKDQYQYLGNCPPTPPLTCCWVRGGVGGQLSRCWY